MSEFWRSVASDVLAYLIIAYVIPLIIAMFRVLRNWLTAETDRPASAPAQRRSLDVGGETSGGARSLSALNVLPLLTFPLLLYNFIVISGIAPLGGVDAWMLDPFFAVGAFSGEVLYISFSEIFMVTALVLVFLEVVKATRTEAMSILEHGLSMLVSWVSIVQFVAMPGYSNTAFFWLVMMSLLAVVAQFTVTIVAVRRDLGEA